MRIKKTSQYIEGGTGLPSYFTTETNTGMKWIDGKTIYRKVINGTLADGDLDIDLTSLNIDTLINCYGRNGGTGEYRPINFDYVGYQISTRYSGGHMYIFASTPYANTLFNMIIEYTKTTD